MYDEDARVWRKQVTLSVNLLWPDRQLEPPGVKTKLRLKAAENAEEGKYWYIIQIRTDDAQGNRHTDDLDIRVIVKKR